MLYCLLCWLLLSQARRWALAVGTEKMRWAKLRTLLPRLHAGHHYLSLRLSCQVAQPEPLTHSVERESAVLCGAPSHVHGLTATAQHDHKSCRTCGSNDSYSSASVAPAAHNCHAFTHRVCPRPPAPGP